MLRKILRISIILFVILVPIFVVIANFLNNSKTLYTSNVIYEEDLSGQRKFAVLRNNLVVTSTTETLALDKRGNVLWTVETILANPKLQTAGDYVLVADINGKNFYVIRNGTVIYQKFLANTIFNAQINESGYVALTGAEDGFSSQITVYNSRGDEVFHWGIADNFALDCIVSPDNKNLSASLYSAENGNIINKISFIDLQKKETFQDVKLENSIIYSLNYNSDGNLFAISDVSALYFNKSGEKIWENIFSPQVLIDYEFLPKNGFALFLENAINTADFKFFNLNNQEKNFETMDFYPKYISNNSASVLCIGSGKFNLFNNNGKMKKNAQLEKGFYYQYISGNGKYFYAVSGDGIEIVNLK